MSPRFGRKRNHSHIPSAQDGVLTALRDGERAIVEGFAGGTQMQARLSNMGLHPGSEVTKIGAMPGRGPVTVNCNGFRLALGWGIAHRVKVRRLGDTITPDNTQKPST